MVTGLFKLKVHGYGRILWHIGISLCWFSSGQAITGVEDAGANIKLFEILKTGQGALNEMTKTANNLQEMNSVLGNQLPSHLLGKLGQFSSMATDLGGLMGGLTGDGSDPLQSLNSMGQQYGKSRDYSQFLVAKDYFKHKFYPDTNQPLSLDRSHQIQHTRVQAADEAVVSSIALSDQQIKGLQVEHAQLMEMSKNLGQSDTLNYQLNLQTRLLQKIVMMLERIALIQSKMLDLQAKQHLREQPVVGMQSGRR